MKLQVQNTQPVQFTAEISKAEAEVIRAAYTDRICRTVLELEEDGNLDDIPDIDVFFALQEGDEEVDLSTESLQEVRSVLLDFGELTLASVRDQVRARYDAHYYSASLIPERIKLGRTALKLGRQIAEQQTNLTTDDKTIEAAPASKGRNLRRVLIELPPGQTE